MRDRGERLHDQFNLADHITQDQWAAKYQEAQATATRATKLELDRSYDAAFTAYIAAAQTYLFLVRHTVDPDSRSKFRAVSAKLVERAERIKAARKHDIKPVQRDPLSLEEQDSVLEQGGAVYGRRLRRWTGAEGYAAAGPAPAPPPLSPAQQAAGCTWVRCAEALPGARMVAASVRGLDVVQDNVADCSVVSALIVAAEHHARHRSRLALSSVRHPLDGLPSPPADVAVRADFDDQLPVAATGRPMFASTRQHDQLWPALIEKAYLTLMGGYDFVGSNSANDLCVMSGWLPETIPLRTGLKSEAAWQRIRSGFSLGHCVLTVGTGKAVDEDSRALGLVSSHDYAVLDVREERGVRQLVIVNPWRTAESGESWTAGLREALDDAPGPEPLIVDWEALPAHFEALHVNWDPTTFENSATAHLSAPASTAARTSASTASKNRHVKRIRLEVEPNPPLPSEVWLFLARHSGSPLEKGEYVGLGVARSSGALSSTDEALRLDDSTSMHDNLFDLYRFMPDPGATSFDLVISHEGRAPDFRFTLSAYSNSRVKIIELPAPLPHVVKTSGSWTTATAGGNHTCATFLHNPQYCVTLKPPSSPPGAKATLEVVGETDKDSPINVKLLFRGGARVAEFESRDVVAGGSTYAHGRTSFSSRDLAPGSYTLIVSSFQPRHLADFSLVLRSSLPLEVAPIPAEGAGMYARQAKGAWADGCDGGKGERRKNPRFALRVTRPTNVKIRLLTPAGPRPIAVSLFSASRAGEPLQQVASSGAYSDAVCGVVLPLTRLEPAEHGYLVVPSTFLPGVHADFSISLYADSPVTLARIE
ncbi:hypothetical protein JCM9279_003224 [Rhodotorula babjevae]